MTDIDILLTLKEVLLGRSISQIDKSQDFIIHLNHYPIKKDGYPNLIMLTMLSDWYIKEIGDWADINNLFPLDTSTLSIPYEPMKAYYLHYLSENRKITEVIFDNISLEIKFGSDFTVVLPNKNQYDHLAWIVAGNEIQISYNSEENKCYFDGI